MAVNLASLIGRSLLPRRGRALMRDERGATAIEVGLLALPFFSIIGAILETSVVFLSGQVLDSAVQDTTRFIRTGQMQAANYTIENFRTSVCSRLYGLFDCSKLRVEVQVLNSFSAASVSPPVNFSCSTQVECDAWTRNEVFVPGDASEIVVAQVYYRWPVILNFAGVNLASLPTGERVLGAARVFRNEPF